MTTGILLLPITLRRPSSSSSCARARRAADRVRLGRAAAAHAARWRTLPATATRSSRGRRRTSRRTSAAPRGGRARTSGGSRRRQAAIAARRLATPRDGSRSTSRSADVPPEAHDARAAREPRRRRPIASADATRRRGAARPCARRETEAPVAIRRRRRRTPARRDPRRRAVARATTRCALDEVRRSASLRTPTHATLGRRAACYETHARVARRRSSSTETPEASDSPPPNLDTAVVRLGANGRPDDPRGGGDDRLVAAHAALRRAHRARRAPALGLRLPPLRPRRAAAPAHPARAARRARHRPRPTSRFACACAATPSCAARSTAGSRPRPSVPSDVPAADWLRWEQEKHQRLLAAAAQHPDTDGDRMTATATDDDRLQGRRPRRSPTSAARRSSSPSTRCPA